MAEETRTPEQEVEVKQSEPAGEAKKPVSSRWASPIDEMERMVDEYFPRGWLRRWEWPAFPEFARRMEMRLPRVDVIDRAEDVLVKAEVPGVEKDDLEVSVTGDTVTIKGRTSHEEKEEKGDFFRSEISRGSFSRTVSLPGEVEAADAKASFKNGVLELVLRKKPEAKRQTISID